MVYLCVTEEIKEVFEPVKKELQIITENKSLDIEIEMNKEEMAFALTGIGKYQDSHMLWKERKKENKIDEANRCVFFSNYLFFTKKICINE